MEWLLLFFAGSFEIIWAVSMKYSNGFTVPIPSTITAITYILSAIFLALSLKHLPLGTAYIMWVGFGMVGTAICGRILFNEKLTGMQMICILIIILGITGLKLFEKN